MYRGPSRYFKVVRSYENHFAVWHADAIVMKSWQETGRYGSLNDCWDFIESCEGQRGYLFKFGYAQ